MNKEDIIYTNGDLIIFKEDRGTCCSLGNSFGKSLKDIEKEEGKEIKEVYRYVSKKKIIYKSKEVE